MSQDSSPDRQPEHLSLDDALEEARRRRDEGLTAARTAAWPGYKIAVEKALDQLAESGRPFTVDDVRRIAGDPIGTSPQALGGMIAHAAKRGQIRAIGYQQSARPEAHARPVRLWRGVA